MKPDKNPKEPAGAVGAPGDGAADEDRVEVKTPRKAVEAHVGALAAETGRLLSGSLLADAAASASLPAPDPGRTDALLARLAREYSPEALLALAEGILAETKKKAGRDDLSINEVETVLAAHLSAAALRDMIVRRATSLLQEPPAADPGAAAPPADTPEAWRAKAEEYLNLARTVQADFDNYRKRAKREAEEFRKLATAELVKNLLPVLDALDLAVVHDKTGKADEGVGKVRKLLFTQLQKEGLEEVGAEGEPFDPLLHQAISEEEREGIERETVIELCRKGFKMGDRVLRPAMVRVGVPAEGGASPAVDVKA